MVVRPRPQVAGWCRRTGPARTFLIGKTGEGRCEACQIAEILLLSFFGNEIQLLLEGRNGIAFNRCCLLLRSLLLKA